jgi:hypothetical protein
MNKRTLGISGLILAALSSLCADDLPSSNQGKEATGLVNPSSRFQVDDGWNLFLNTEFLWWVAKEDSLYYAQSGYSNQLTSAVPPNGTIDFDGHLERVTPDWSPGFRVGFGGNMSYDEWDIFLNWTWFKSHARDSSHASKRGVLLVLWGHPDVDSGANSANGAVYAKGLWNMRLNTLDLELARSFWVGKHFSLRPFFGARAAWIDQDFKIDYHLTTTPITEAELKAESDFEGGGVRAGLDARFTLLGGWSFYGLASASMLYGHFDCDFHEEWVEDDIARTRDGFHQAVSTAQLALGVRWDTYVHHDRYHFGLYAGWEQNIWFGLNKMNRYFHQLHEGNLEQLNSDLTLQGGTFGIHFDF